MSSATAERLLIFNVKVYKYIVIDVRIYGLKRTNEPKKNECNA